MPEIKLSDLQEAEELFGEDGVTISNTEDGGVSFVSQKMSGVSLKNFLRKVETILTSSDYNITVDDIRSIVLITPQGSEMLWEDGSPAIWEDGSGIAQEE